MGEGDVDSGGVSGPGTAAGDYRSGGAAPKAGRRGCEHGSVRPIVLFDLDNTLVDRQAAYRRWAVDFAAAAGLDEAAVAWLVRADDDGFADRQVLFRAAREEFGLPESVGDLVEQYRRRYPTYFEPDQGVLDGLRRLRSAGWRIVVVTNGPPSQREKVTRAGLDPLIDALCISEELGVAKPDPRIFAEARRRSGAPPEEVGGWMVGDTAHPDIGGGRAAGLRTVWLHRGRPWDSSVGYHPDVTVADVLEALDVLLGGSGRRSGAGGSDR